MCRGLEGCQKGSFLAEPHVSEAVGRLRPVPDPIRAPIIRGAYQTRSRNFTGAILFRSTTPGTIATPFAWWDLGPLGTFSALALTFEGLVFALLREEPTRANRLLLGGVFYSVFVVADTISVFQV